MEKNSKNRFYVNAQLRAAATSEDQNEFEFVITSDKVDTYRTIFSHEGWDFKRYKENPVVFYQHRSHGDDPDNLIGMTVKGPTPEVLEDGTRVHVATVRFEPKEVNEKAEKIRKKIINGTLRMASIGADVLEYHWGSEERGEDEDTVYFTKQELFEWSIVTLGANSAAHVRNTEFMTAVRSEKEAATSEEETTAEQASGGEPYKRKSKTGFNITAARLEIAKYKYK